MFFTVDTLATTAIVGGLTSSLVGGIRGGVEGAALGLVLGAAIAPAAIITAAGFGVAGASLLGFSTGAGIIAGETGLFALGVGLSLRDLATARNPRDALAAIVELLLAGYAGYYAFNTPRPVITGRETFQNLSATATPDEVAAGQALARYRALDVLLVSPEPGASRGPLTSDIRIRFQGDPRTGGERWEIYNATAQKNEESFKRRIEEKAQQADRIAVIYDGSRWTPGQLESIGYRVLGTRPRVKQIQFIRDEASFQYTPGPSVPSN